ncbi:MAG: methylglutaconyl-CoA hydratase, partial [Thermomicrobiales bacterium]|nr:methylglutaconyl-CoA hydratase [Thermomicrobiales bacterium]
MEQTVLIERTGEIATVTMNRPDARNALSRQLGADLLTALTDLSRDEQLRVLILTGAGERAFCAGADLIERRTLTSAELTTHTESINAVCDALAGFPVPTFAAIRGFALAGGAELAIACDLRIAGEDAVLGFPEVKIGVFPGAGGDRDRASDWTGSDGRRSSLGSHGGTRHASLRRQWSNRGDRG